MKFDIVIGNPPYQVSDGGGTGDSAKPVYNDFIDAAKSMEPEILSMICPSRWMKGGKGLDTFRNQMMEDTHIKSIHDFENSAEFFPSVHIDGGVCYFLWCHNYDGKCNFYHKGLNGFENNSFRYLKNDVSDTVIRDFRQYSIIKKSKENITFSSIVYSRNPYGFYADFFNTPEKYPDIKQYDECPKKGNYIKIYGVKGKKGGAKRVTTYIAKDTVCRNQSDISKYKLFFSKAYMATSTVPPEIIIGKPNEICTETFLQIGSFDTMQKANNALSYIKTKFFRALLFYNRHSLNISQESFSLIPLQDFTQSWTDEKLYKKYGLNKEEIDFIETMIKPME